MSRALRTFGETNARELIRTAGMDEAHPDFKFFLTILTKVCEAATQHTRQFRVIGERLQQLAHGERIGKKGIAQIRRLANSLSNVDLSPDINAVRGMFVAVKSRAIEFDRQSANEARRQTNRNTRIRTRFERATMTMSQRAAARLIRSEMSLELSIPRIIQIATRK